MGIPGRPGPKVMISTHLWSTNLTPTCLIKRAFWILRDTAMAKQGWGQGMMYIIKKSPANHCLVVNIVYFYISSSIFIEESLQMYKIMRHVAYWYQISQNPSKKTKKLWGLHFLVLCFWHLYWIITMSIYSEQQTIWCTNGLNCCDRQPFKHLWNVY